MYPEYVLRRESHAGSYSASQRRMIMGAFELVGAVIWSGVQSVNPSWPPTWLPMYTPAGNGGICPKGIGVRRLGLYGLAAP